VTVTRTMRLRRHPSGAGAALLLAVLALAAVGCSATNGAADASPVATTKVDLPKSYKFAPAAITVTAGSTVTWTNDDNFTHSVQFLDRGLPSDPHLMQPGQTTTFTFAKPGTYHYQCSLHPQNMKGTVTVSA
jgi:plastocyanin